MCQIIVWRRKLMKKGTTLGFPHFLPEIYLNALKGYNEYLLFHFLIFQCPLLFCTSFLFPTSSTSFVVFAILVLWLSRSFLKLNVKIVFQDTIRSGCQFSLVYSFANDYKKTLLLKLLNPFWHFCHLIR